MNSMSKITVAILSASIAGNVLAADIEVEPRGRLHLDAGFVNDDQTEFGNGVNVRRGRMGLQGNFSSDWRFVIEYDFAEGGDASATDVNLRTKFAGGSLTIGHQRLPFSLNTLTSSNSMTFMERASGSTVITPDRKLGVRFDKTFGDITSGSMAFGRTMNTESDAGKDDSMGLAQRLVYHPKIDNIQYHFGAAVVYQDLGDYNSLRFRDRPELRIDPAIRLIDTGTLNNVDNLITTGLEFAAINGAWSFEAEALSVNTSSAVQDLSFSGYHMQASYVITGESRSYKNGSFSGIKPSSAKGAIEVAARYSVTDLNDGVVMGGEQKNLTVGVNYYLSSNIRFMSNIVYTDVDTASGINEEPIGFGVRAQYHF
ncbi:MAG: porin [Rheinheimera sp.]|uniref:OprO/OprP family phosphate-selective porin n=2 Tax=Chromatiaceae TaxID=1046 RepID=UPI0003805133|nr:MULTISPECIES: porin [Arsukibacterium]MAA93171.1 porin [Rheinheimera sp.]MBM33703.1 porin [Rheinheimera sp.]|tara:strand:+ start:47028 stop:48137 length:1110 start_codon:yes stop_codon:yes gene_type:complete